MKPKRCPFGKFKTCIPDCELWIESTRKYDNSNETVIIKGCSIKYIWEELAGQTQRLAMMQSEIGETKNANIFQAVAMLCQNDKAKSELLKIVKKHIPNIQQLE